jgi:hypothetical protein
MTRKRLTGLAAAAALTLVLAAAQASASPADAATATPRTGTLAASPFAVDASPGDQTDPHVWANTVSYTNEVSGNSEIRVYDTRTGATQTVPNGGGLDFLSDVFGSTVYYTHLADDSAIWQYDTGNGTSEEVAPTANANRRESRAGDGLVAWQDFGYTNDVTTPEISILERVLATTPYWQLVRLTNDALLDKDPAVSPNGSTVAWTKCRTDGTGCAIWSAQLGSTGWDSQALTDPAAGEAQLPDTDGSWVVYSVVDPSGDEDVYWQPAGGGPAHRLALPGQQTNPNVSEGAITFEQLDTSTQVPNYDVYLYDIPTNTLYRLTDTPEDETLNDVSVWLRRTTVVWTTSELDDNVYGETFQLPPVAWTLALSAQGGQVTATAHDTTGALLPDALVRWIATDGETGSCTTGADGTCSFTVAGPGGAVDATVTAWADTNDNGVYDEDSGEAHASATLTFAGDTTPPQLRYAQSPDGANGWFRSAPASLRVTASDDGGVASLSCTLDGAPVALTGESADATTRSGTVAVSTDGDHAVSCTAADGAGNDAAATETRLLLDTTPPSVSVDGFDDGAEVLLDATAPAATCSSDDATSGVAGTTGPETRTALTANGVGTVTVTCGASDTAGNEATAARTYRVVYGVHGFLWPVRNPPAVDVGRAGRAFPLRWRLVDADGRPLHALSPVASLRYRAVPCGAFADGSGGTDAESAGRSGVHWDPLTKSYVFVWKTPRERGCYTLALTLDSGQVVEAYVRLR